MKVLKNYFLSLKRKNYKYNLFKYVRGSLLIKNVFTVASGAAIAQLIGTIFSPIITRLYGPEIFGVFGTFTSLTAVLAPVIALTYPMAIVLPRSDEEAKGIAMLSLIIGGVLSVAIALILILIGPQVLSLLNMQVLIPFMLFIPILLFLAASQQVMEQWVIRRKKFDVTARTFVIHSFFLNVTKIGIGVLYTKIIVLIILTLLGQAISISLLLLGINGGTFKKTETKISKKQLKSLAYRYIDFPLNRAPEMALYGLTQGLPIIMLASLFGPSTAGFYAIGKRLLSIPSQIVGKAIGDVFYPRVVEAAHNKESVSKLVLTSTATLAILGIVPFGFIFFFGPSIFSFVFGSQWAQAGVFARWMSLWTYSMFVNNICVRTMPVISEQRLLLIITSTSTFVRICALALGGYVFKNDTLAIILYSLAGVVKDVILISLVIAKAKIYDEINR